MTTERKTPGLKSQPPEITDSVSAKAFLRWCVAEIGPTYHPDTPFADYTERNGLASFTLQEQRLLDERQAKVAVILDHPCPGVLDEIRQLQGRWIGILETRAGGDYDHKQTADSPDEVAEVVKRLLDD